MSEIIVIILLCGMIIAVIVTFRMMKKHPMPRLSSWGEDLTAQIEREKNCLCNNTGWIVNKAGETPCYECNPGGDWRSSRIPTDEPEGEK